MTGQAETTLAGPAYDANPTTVAPLRLRTGRGWSLRLALGVILFCALLLGCGQLALGIDQFARGASAGGDLYGVAVFTTVFWVWIAAGVIAWWRRPNNATGAVIIVGGLALLLGGLGNLNLPFFIFIGSVFGASVLAVSIHLLHAFPSGRLQSSFSTAIVICAYIVAIGLQAPVYFITDSAIASGLMTAQTFAGMFLMLLTAIVLVSRLRTADRAHRRLLAPLYLYGSLAVLLIPAAPQVLGAFGVTPLISGTVQVALLAGLPISFLIGVLLGGFTSTIELETLSAWLGLAGAHRATVARAMASTLGDESLRIVYWSPERSTFVDGSGAPIDVPHGEHGRTRLDVFVESRLIGAIIYDSRVVGGANMVRRASEILAIAIDRERLTAELRASNDELLQSRVRLVEAADRERSRIAQDLHDGLQVQLVLLALEAQQIGGLPGASTEVGQASVELRQRIDDAAADLRRLVHNVLPGALVERGLSAAVDDLVDRIALPVSLVINVDDESLAPATTHTAYFIVAEALTNSIKHSHATTITLVIDQADDRLYIDIEDNGVGGASLDAGTGLRGLAERVDVLGGSFTMESNFQHGTRVKVELPCEL